MVKINNLEYFYSDFIKQINLVASFTERPELSQIITMCRLKPYDCILGKYTDNIIFHNRWIDEYNNCVILKKNSMKITQFNLFDKSKITNTDLYKNLSIQKISNISKFVYFLKGRDEDTLENHYILAFLGMDDYLRVYVFIYGQWQQYPPLLLGEKILLEIINNLDLRMYRESKMKGQVIYPCEDQSAWLSCWPPHESFVSDVLKQDEIITSLLNIRNY